MKIVEYFEQWMEEKEAYKKPQPKVGEEGERKRKRKDEGKSEKKATKGSGSTWRSYFLADLTHTNLRLGVAGFFGYSCSALNMVEGAPRYVPALHSNQSSIEALFSWIRKVGRDKALQLCQRYFWQKCHMHKNGGKCSGEQQDVLEGKYINGKRRFTS